MARRAPRSSVPPESAGAPGAVMGATAPGRCRSRAAERSAWYLLLRPARRSGAPPTAGAVRRPLALVMLNRCPYNNLLTPEESIELAAILGHSVQRLRAAYNPGGLNVGLNLGRAAGTGIADHMHWHLVTRSDGDTNFMPVMVSTRVLPQSLAETGALLEPLFKAIDTALS